ncbi:hypothetical protein KSF_108200 [Reticulibacter mediterranei]|uniref:Uncharacterized protein n=1 Tax=Reticulibacter mediterranei TaxID=2778369 RepID=A0A8J3NAU4_9CHLR|nr:hypothetical protein [Reticulibacter mediterranei]GHP00773.1 hypothetical protein KSF_108200 [Reticulibacter mediterranei]
MRHDKRSSREDRKGQPTLIVGGAFCLGLLVMSLRYGPQLGLILSQFPALWSIEQNRPVILGLFARMFLTAFVFAAFALAGVLVWYAMKSSRHEVKTPIAHLPQQYQRSQQHVPPFTDTSLPQQPHEVILPSLAPALMQAATQEQTMQSLPILPLPPSAQTPIMSHTHVHTKESNGDAVQEAHHLDQQAEHALPDKHDSGAQGEPTIEIHLLRQVKMDLCIQEKRYPIIIDDLNVRARHLIAYIAWHKGEHVQLGEMRTDVFGSEEADTEQVQSAFSTAKRDIRRRIDEAVERARKELGESVLPKDLDLDLFTLLKGRKYTLASYCQIVDLSFIESQHQIIEGAESAIEQTKTVPQHVKDACDALIKAYKGDFIEDLLDEDADALDPWPQSWAREPFTRLRDYYLTALLYAGEYERKATNYANAAELFARGAMAACNNRIKDGRFDTTVYFSKAGSKRFGPHVVLSEQLIRRALACYGMIGSTTAASRAYALYEKQMLLVWGHWTPQPETTKVKDAVRDQTGAYEFPDTIATPYGMEDEQLLRTESA